MFERLAYASVVLQMAVYISQKDLVGGLHFEQSTKGWIFFCWAIVQNFTPVLFGGLSDKYGKKRIILISIFISLIGFIGIASFRDLLPFSISTIILGFGLGLFKPTIQGLISQSMNIEQKSIGWSINVMLINVAVFLAPPLTKFLEEISWFWVFAGNGIVISINILIILLMRNKIKEIEYNDQNRFDISVIKLSLKGLLQAQVIYFLLIMSGFTIIYMQFYESLPNFLYDWTDTSSLVKILNLPDFMTNNTQRGIMIDFKWLYNINSGLIVIFVVLIGHFLSKFSIFKSLIIGLLLVSVGIALSGISHYGSIAVLGMMIYTFGEMISNPKISEFMSKHGDEKYRSMYMGLINISFGIGLAGGSLLGGYLYKYWGEKSGLALNYAKEHFPNISNNLTHHNSLEFLSQQYKLNSNEITDMLFNYYHPQIFWLPFIIIGFVSIVLLFVYNKKYKDILR
ncbi:MAG TPA: MFS transporter [Candidatus Kapabacteria bacterium]|nr:MFS transporter [Candidatus Kapabacteria bacterium]